MPVLDSGTLAMIAADYVSGMSTRQIAEKFSLNVSAARKAILDSGAEMRSLGDAVRLSFSQGRVDRSNSRGWPIEAVRASAEVRRAKARGKSVKPNGYVEFTTGENKFRSEHVVVMEAHIGRRIAKGEHVHHIDGNKQNNAITNLVLMRISDHAKLHATQRAPLRARDELGRFSGGKITEC